MSEPNPQPCATYRTGAEAARGRRLDCVRASECAGLARAWPGYHCSVCTAYAQIPLEARIDEADRLHDLMAAAAREEQRYNLEVERDAARKVAREKRALERKAAADLKAIELTAVDEKEAGELFAAALGE